MIIADNIQINDKHLKLLNKYDIIYDDNTQLEELLISIYSELIICSDDEKRILKTLYAQISYLNSIIWQEKMLEG
jgi:hypothetical protein